MPTPPAIPGTVWRPARAGDVPGLVDLASTVDASEELEFVGGPDFWTWWLDQHDLDTDTLVAVEGTGRIIAGAGSWGQDTTAGARSILWFDAHPDFLSVDPFLLEWAEACARRQLAGSTHRDRVIRFHVEEHRNRRRTIAEEAGFGAVRTFVEMERPLAAPIDQPTPPAGPTIETWRPDLDEPTRKASNAAFADHWGSLPMSPDTWASMVVDDDVIRRDLSFLALDAGAVIAMCLTSVDHEDDPNAVWLDRVAVVPGWRRRGLASALVLHSLQAAAASGLESARLTVDEESGWDAPGMYRLLGFSMTKRSVTYTKEIE
jgi:ribosomal protein S18 acetylase RimI-like enzyme